MTNLSCLTCPVCGEPPSFVMSPEQAFCSNEACPSFCWNMTWTRDKNLDEVSFIDVSKLFVNGDQM